MNEKKIQLKNMTLHLFSFVFAETLKFFCSNLSPMEFYTLASKYRRINLPWFVLISYTIWKRSFNYRKEIMIQLKDETIISNKQIRSIPSFVHLFLVWFLSGSDLPFTNKYASFLRYSELYLLFPYIFCV